jgi:hypothetical protein
LISGKFRAPPDIPLPNWLTEDPGGLALSTAFLDGLAPSIAGPNPASALFLLPKIPELATPVPVRAGARGADGSTKPFSSVAVKLEPGPPVPKRTGPPGAAEVTTPDTVGSAVGFAPVTAATTADAAAAAAGAPALAPFWNPYINPAISQCKITVKILMKLVTEYRNDPFIISEINPDKIAISGENAPNNAKTGLIPAITPDPPAFADAAFNAAEIPGKNVITTTTISSRNDKTLKVSDAVAKFVLVSGILC